MDFNPQQQHILLSKMGYTGPANPKMMDAFLSSNPGAAARMGKFSRAAQKMNAGNMGMAQGGTANKAPLPTAFTVKTSGGKMDERTYTVVDSTGKVVFGPTPNKGAADADAKSRNAAASTPAPTTTTPATGTPGTSTNPAPGGHPSWITPPPPGSITTQALVEHTNPITGEKWTAPTGGYTVNVSAPAPTTPPTTGTPTTGGGFTVRRVGGQGEWEYQVRDSANKIVATFATEAQAKADVAARNAAANPAPTTPPVTGTPTNPDTTTPPATGGSTPTTPAAPVLSAGEQVLEGVIKDPTAYVTTPTVSTTAITPETLIDATTGQAGATTATTSGVTDATTATAPDKITPTDVTATKVSTDVSQAAAALKPEVGTVSSEAKAEAQQQTTSSIADMQAEQGEAYILQNPVKREIEAGEMLSGSSVDATKVSEYLASIQAAQATPTAKATVQGQLSELMTQFEGGKTPAWAAGAMRSAQAMLAERGLGASSMAGQAVIQAAMEAALPIAQVDANTFAQFEAQNLSNRQQTALFAAQQRANFLQQDFDQTFQTRVLNAAKVADIANMNFTAEQNIALENSRAINTMNIANLDARNAMTLAKAAALSNLDIANLNNRQQAAIQNANAFLQMDMTNLSNRQQTALTAFQANIQAMFTDQAADNATKQFNAASKNQADQFFADLSARVTMFNAEQTNTIKQFNTGEANATARLNAQLDAQRQQFNATNSLLIAQANAKWRQDVTTAATEAQNNANRDAAQAANVMTTKAMEELWQKERDTMSYVFTAIQNDADRATELLLADKREDLIKWQEAQEEKGFGAALVYDLFKNPVKDIISDWMS